MILGCVNIICTPLALVRLTLSFGRILISRDECREHLEEVVGLFAMPWLLVSRRVECLLESVDCLLGTFVRLF